MHELNTNSEPAADAEQLRPVLDQVMGQLNDRDRDAVMLRFFEGHPFAKVGAKLRLTEDAARMRVERALEKMRTQLVRRGVTSTTAALATVLAGQAGVAAPMGLASSVTGGSLTSAGAFTTFAASLGLTKLQLTLASALLFASGGAVVLQQRATSALAREIAAGDAEPTAELAKLREENRRLAETAAEIRSYQGDAAELARVRAEAAALTQRWQDRAAKPVGRDAADGDPTRIYEPNELDSQPVPTLQPIPVYPFDMRRVGQGGTAVVSFVVDENGRVRDAAIVRSTRSEFEASAMESVMKWKFRPGQKNGSPVTTKMTVPIVFSMEEEP